MKYLKKFNESIEDYDMLYEEISESRYIELCSNLGDCDLSQREINGIKDIFIPTHMSRLRAVTRFEINDTKLFARKLNDDWFILIDIDYGPPQKHYQCDTFEGLINAIKSILPKDFRYGTSEYIN